MSLKSQELIVDLTKELDLPFEYRKHGSILVCDNDDEMQAAVDLVKILRENCLKFNVLEPKVIKEESPFFADDIPGGLECETDSLIIPYLFCYSLIDKAQQYGLNVMTHSEVVNMSYKNKEYTMETNNQTVIANRIVNDVVVWAPFIV